MSTKILFKVLKNLAFLSIGLLLLYLAFREQNFKQLLSDLKGANYFYVGLSVAIGLLAYISRGIRWLILLEPLGFNAKLSNSVYSILVGYFANLAIPRIGEITRCTSMSQAEKIPVDKLFGTVILERIIDLFMLFMLTVLAIFMKVDLFGAFFLDLFNANKEKYPTVLYTLIVLTVFGLISLLVLYLIRSRVSHFPLAIKIRAFFLGIKEGLVSVRKIKKRKTFYFHTFLIWFCYYLMTWLVFYSLEETSHLTPIDGLFILVVGGFGMAAPVQGGIGAYHFIVSLGMGVLGISNSIALSFATIVHTSQTLFILLAGSVSLILLYVANRKSKRISITQT